MGMLRRRGEGVGIGGRREEGDCVFYFIQQLPVIGGVVIVNRNLGIVQIIPVPERIEGPGCFGIQTSYSTQPTTASPPPTPQPRQPERGV